MPVGILNIAARSTYAGARLFAVLAGFHDGAKYFSSANHDVAGSRFHIEDEKSALIARQARMGLDRCAVRHGFQVIDFDSRADADRAGRQFTGYRSRGRMFHQLDHARSGQHGWKFWVERLDRPFIRNYGFKCVFKPNGRARKAILGKSRRGPNI